MLAGVQTERAAAGCSALAPDADLASAAAEQSAAMATSGVVGLLLPEGGLPGLGARLGAVTAGVDAPAGVVAGWLASDSAALLDCSLTRAGVAEYGGYWTLLTA